METPNHKLVFNGLSKSYNRKTPLLLSDAEILEDLVEEVFGVKGAGDLGDGFEGFAEVAGGEFGGNLVEEFLLAFEEQLAACSEKVAVAGVDDDGGFAGEFYEGFQFLVEELFEFGEAVLCESRKSMVGQLGKVVLE